jgi:hypothetical protein
MRMTAHRHRRNPRSPNTLTPEQTGQLLRLKPGTLARQARLGKIEVIKTGRLNQYPVEEVRRRIWTENPRVVAEKLILVLDEFVEANNAVLEQENRNGRHKG